MGFLKMIGAVSAEEHAKLDARLKTALTDLANEVEARERIQRTLNDAQGENNRLARGWDKCGDDLKAMRTERDEAVRNCSTMSGTVSERDAEIVALKAELADLKPDAEAMRRRRANDAKRARPSRSKKVGAVEAVKAATKDAIDNGVLKSGPATGKPRTAIAANVGKATTAKISGGRPAKKAKR